MSSPFFLTNYSKNLVIDHKFRTRTWAKPTQIWWALFTVAPTEVGGGTEVVGGSYARVALAPLDANYAATQGGNAGNSTGTTGLTSNSVVITFPGPSVDWGNVVALGQFDANAAGNLEGWMLLTAAAFIHAGDTASSFPLGALVVQIP